MFLGNYILGDTVPLDVGVTTGADGAGTLPASPPALRVYDAAGNLVKAVAMPPADRFGCPGLFSFALTLDSSFALGTYRVAFLFQAAGVSYLKVASFKVVEGGSTAGPVLALYGYVRPHASFLLERQPKQRALARNPRL